MMTIPLSS